MKKLNFLPFILIICLLAGSVLACPALALEDPEVLSRNAIVIDMSNCAAFYSSQSKPLRMAEHPFTMR